MSQYGGFNNQSSGPVFVINIPGQEPQAVDNFTLRSWAQSKYIQPTTQVQDTRNGSIYTASQIPGVFSDKEYVVALNHSINFEIPSSTVVEGEKPRSSIELLISAYVV